MTKLDIELAMFVIAIIGIIVGIVKAIIIAGEKKQQFTTLRSDVDRHEEQFKKMISEEDHLSMQKACRAEINQIISNRLNQEMKEIRSHHDEIFNDIYDQITVMNSNLCHLMGAMQVEPVRSPKRRRKTDASRNFEEDQ